MRYNWQQKDWPDFHYEMETLEPLLAQIAHQTGKLGGVAKAMPEGSRYDVIVDAMVSEAIKSSSIEGENLDREDVQSSVRNQLGLNKIREKVKDEKAKRAGELMVLVRNSFDADLDEQMLFDWHRVLLGFDDTILLGAWRTHEEPMQVVSGALGKQKVHFEAPPSSKVAKEMKQFLRWFNATAPGAKKKMLHAPIRAAIAHLYFESIHPFEDGNGRLGRAIAEKALSQGAGHPILMSLSVSIEAKKKDYYKALQKAQMGNEITTWLRYFLTSILEAQHYAETKIDFVLGKAHFYDRYNKELNPRHLKAIQRVFDEGPEGFTGGLTAKKYMAITKVSKATATRDLQFLTELGAIKLMGGGRSTHYEVCLPV